MAMSILECERLDRYQFEVFVGHVDVAESALKASDTDANENSNRLIDSRPKVDNNNL